MLGASVRIAGSRVVAAAVLAAFSFISALAGQSKNWPTPVWALATVCDDQLNCEKKAARVPDIILEHSDNVSECTAFIIALTGGTHVDKDGNVSHTAVVCAVSERAPKGYHILSASE